jgi:hypothetical protein
MFPQFLFDLPTKTGKVASDEDVAVGREASDHAACEGS